MKVTLANGTRFVNLTSKYFEICVVVPARLASAMAVKSS